MSGTAALCQFCGNGFRPGERVVHAYEQTWITGEGGRREALDAQGVFFHRDHFTTGGGRWRKDAEGAIEDFLED